MPVFQPVRAVERALLILRIINAQDGSRIQQLATMTKIPRPTVFRLLETLEAQGYVMKSKSDDTWHPTLECNALSSGFLDKAWVGQIAMPEMVNLGRKILWPLDLVTYSDKAMKIRETTHKFSPFSFDVGMVGTEIPMLHTAGGHVYLAYCSDAEREAILDFMRKSDAPEHALAHDEGTIQQIIQRTRDKGFGYRTDGYKGHTSSISVPIFQQGEILAALTIVCLNSALSFDEIVRKYSKKLRTTCKKIGDNLDASLER